MDPIHLPLLPLAFPRPGRSEKQLWNYSSHQQPANLSLPPLKDPSTLRNRLPYRDLTIVLGPPALSHFLQQSHQHQPQLRNLANRTRFPPPSVLGPPRPLRLLSREPKLPNLRQSLRRQARRHERPFRQDRRLERDAIPGAGGMGSFLSVRSAVSLLFFPTRVTSRKEEQSSTRFSFSSFPSETLDALVTSKSDGTKDIFLTYLERESADAAVAAINDPSFPVDAPVIGCWTNLSLQKPCLKTTKVVSAVFSYHVEKWLRGNGVICYRGECIWGGLRDASQTDRLMRFVVFFFFLQRVGNLGGGPSFTPLRTPHLLLPNPNLDRKLGRRLHPLRTSRQRVNPG